MNFLLVRLFRDDIESDVIFLEFDRKHWCSLTLNLCMGFHLALGCGFELYISKVSHLAICLLSSLLVTVYVEFYPDP